MIQATIKWIAAAGYPERFSLILSSLLLLTLFVSTPSPLAAETRKGLTWGLAAHSAEFGIDLVGCHGRPRVDGSSDGPPCNPYQGDTSCSVALPVLCLKTENLPRPAYAVGGKGHAMPAEYYKGWTGGRIGLTEPVRGDKLTSVEAADALCRAQLGEGYRMAEHHDGRYVIGMNEREYHGATWPAEEQLSSGGWHWYAYGNIRGDTRFWVHINDQKQGNCWDKAPTPVPLSDETLLGPGRPLSQPTKKGIPLPWTQNK